MINQGLNDISSEENTYMSISTKKQPGNTLLCKRSSIHRIWDGIRDEPWGKPDSFSVKLFYSRERVMTCDVPVKVSYLWNKYPQNLNVHGKSNWMLLVVVPAQSGPQVPPTLWLPFCRLALSTVQLTEHRMEGSAQEGSMNEDWKPS